VSGFFLPGRESHLRGFRGGLEVKRDAAREPAGVPESARPQTKNPTTVGFFFAGRDLFRNKKVLRTFLCLQQPAHVRGIRVQGERDSLSLCISMNQQTAVVFLSGKNR